MDIGIWEALGYIGVAILTGGGVYGQQRVKQYRNGSGSNSEKTGKYMTITEHERLCPERFKSVHEKLNRMHEDIRELRK